MDKMKKLGLPADVAPTLDLLSRIANGEELEFDKSVATSHIALARYYLRGKLDGMKIDNKDKETAVAMIKEAHAELDVILDIITETQ